MKLYEEFVSRQEIFHGRIVDLRVDTVRLPNGHLTTREVIDHPGGVAVVAIDENDNVLTVKQYRYAFQTVLEELPAGKLERGEDPAAAARSYGKLQAWLYPVLGVLDRFVWLQFDELRILPDFGSGQPTVEDRVSCRVSAQALFIVLAAVRVLYEFWRKKVLDIFL